MHTRRPASALPSPSRRTLLRLAVAGALAPGLLASCGGSDDTDGLTLEQQIGQMVMLGFAGTRIDDAAAAELRRQIAAGRLGGTVFYRYNITDPQQVRTLTAAFEQANPFSLPLLQAIDQEGGRVQRLVASKGFAETPSHEAVAATQTPRQAYETYLRMANMVRDAGFTFNLAPVVDLRGAPGDTTQAPVSPVIGQLQRSFSSDPQTVARYASSFIQAHREAGVLTALKHYPGHGLATKDSHLGLVDITATMRDVEREPFRALIREGMTDAVMTAHLVNRDIDPNYPLTLSDGFFDAQLRRADGFDGVLVTDDLFMGAIIRYHSLEETVLRAIRAGHDLLIFSNNPAAASEVPDFRPQYDLADKVIAIVLRAIERGDLSRERIAASWRRLATLRARLPRR